MCSLMLLVIELRPLRAFVSVSIRCLWDSRLSSILIEDSRFDENTNQILLVIQEYFTKSAGPVKKVMLTYNQNGTSQGIASIIFSKPETAAKAARELNGLLVDGRPMKVRTVYCRIILMTTGQN